MTEYIKFWLSKDLFEIAIVVGLILAIFLGWFLLCFVIDPFVDRFKRWQRRHWNRRKDDVIYRQDAAVEVKDENHS